jgi:hypothetical protein
VENWNYRRPWPDPRIGNPFPVDSFIVNTVCVNYTMNE